MSSRRRILPVAPARARCYNTARVRLAQEAIIMDLVAAVSPMTCAALIAVVLTKPSVRIKGHTVNIFWIVPLIGAAILLLFGTISPREVLAGLTAQNSINPLKILVLFLSMTLISIFLDCAGFFRHLATAVLQRQNASQFRLFALLYALVSVLTVFTSNDIIVLTFTPFICYFARDAKIDPIPYLVCEFVAANTWSMALIIGNPTNIYLATAANVSFLGYIAVMLLPTLFAGLASFGMLALLFRKMLRGGISHSVAEEAPQDPVLVRLGVAHLALCIVLLVFSSYLNLPMWLICFAFFCSLFLLAGLYLLRRGQRLSLLRDAFRAAPWEIVPFILSMFVLVLALDKYGLTRSIGALLGSAHPVASYGASSFLAANLINNIPMSVLFSSIVSGLSGQAHTAALYASVIGSNLGAFFTPLGALAGIMWTGMLRNHGVKLSFGRFLRYGAAVSVPALAAALAGLALVI